MIVKNIVETDFVNYKVPSMFIIFPRCTFKCDQENNCHYCQNRSLTYDKDIEISVDTIVKKYLSNALTSAIVCGGLEPFDSWPDLLALIKAVRQHSADDIVIYTGYYKEEIADKLAEITQFSNIIVKFGRFIPNKPSHQDEVLGVSLASPNQYAEKLS